MRFRNEGVSECQGCYRPFPKYELDEYGECARCADERETERLEMERDLARQMLEDLES